MLPNEGESQPDGGQTQRTPFGRSDGDAQYTAVSSGRRLFRAESSSWTTGLKAVGLVYPSLCRACSTYSSIQFGDIFRIGLKSSIWFDLMYSSVPYLHAHQGDWRVAPYLMPEHLLRQWPPTYIVVFSQDSMRDIGVLFGEKLRRLGAFSKTHIRPGLHGFYGCDFSQFGVEAVEWMSDHLAANLVYRP
eukprot:GHVS01027154.1.p1 GENE.GHVS01027154.1~~GHVS01027154.1.p1  ORF type:complete len:189 (+),score=11.25 GHVS01027154.1:20-586(+)